MGRIHKAVLAQNLIELKKILRSENPNVRDEYHQTPLHLACGLAANTEVVKLLLKKKADVNVQERNGWTPLHCAANEGQLAICQVLLTAENIDVGILNKDGTSTLHYLVRSIPAGADQLLCRDILQLYLENRGDLNSQSKHGESALHQACLRGNMTAAKFLVENNAIVNILNKIGETPLLYAVKGGHQELVKYLLENGADITLKSREGSPFDFSPNNEITEILQQHSREKKRMNAPKTKKNVQLPLQELKLQVKIVRAVNLKENKGKDYTSSFCTVNFGKEQGTTTTQARTLHPIYNDSFLFDTEEIEKPIEIRVYNCTRRKGKTSEPPLLGLVTISLFDMKLDRSGEGISHSVWYTLRPKSSKNHPMTFLSKIQVEFSFLHKNNPIPKEDLATEKEKQEETKKENLSESLNGWHRGSCIISACECKYYQSESIQGGSCQTCGHWPAQHENQNFDEPYEPPAGELSMEQAHLDAHLQFQQVKQRFSQNMTQKTESWEINPKNISFLKRLGDGPMASVFCGTYKNKEVSIKVFNGKMNSKALEEQKKIFQIMTTLDNQFVLPFIGACVKPSIAVVQEFSPKGSLFDVLNSSLEVVDWKFTIRIVREVVNCLHYLHTHRPLILHHNLRSSNVIVDVDGKIRLSDFGRARFVGPDGSCLPTLGKLRGHYTHCAPEIYFGKRFTEQTDIYSLGIIFWELVNRCIKGKYEHPYSDQPEISFHFQIIVQSSKKDLRPTIPKSCPSSISGLMQNMWDKDPQQRPSLHEIQQKLNEIEKEYESKGKEWNKKLKR